MNPQTSNPLKLYKVQIGHAEVVVNGQDQADAVHQARKKLSAEMPRLWDLIYKMEDTQFDVREAG